jgi:hypothetical protein
MSGGYLRRLCQRTVNVSSSSSVVLRRVIPTHSGPRLTIGSLARSDSVKSATRPAMIDRLTQVIAGGAGEGNRWVRFFSLESLGEDLV